MPTVSVPRSVHHLSEDRVQGSASSMRAIGTSTRGWRWQLRSACALLGFLIIACGGACSTVWAGNSVVSRFRLTVEVMTPEGLKTGSSVIETRSWESNWGTPETRGVRSDAKGQAVFVDLG